MSEPYHDENDLKLLRDMRKLAPDDFNAWLGLNNIVGRDNGAIPKKYRELIAIAVSCTPQCPLLLGGARKGSAGGRRDARRSGRSVAHRRRFARRRRGHARRHGAQILR